MVRGGVAVLCMALAFMLSGQTYISLMDRIEHAHHHVHFANPLAGDVQFCTGDHDGCGPHHHHHHADGKDLAGGHANGEADHQHNGDTPIVFLAAQNITFAFCSIPPARCEVEPRSLTGVNAGGFDRPPKTGLEIRT